MRALIVALVVLMFYAVVLSGCEVPTPPPELPTPTPGSQNPENPLSQLALTQIVPTPQRVFEPVNAEPGHIYFVRDGQLWRIAPDGSGETRLSDLAITSAPQPSPDGSWVAFASGSDLYLVPSAGGEARKLASGALAENQRLGWSADSALVGYLTYDTAAPGLLVAWAAPVTGGTPQQIATGVQGITGRALAFEPSVRWSPDGKWVVVGAPGGAARLLRWPLPAGGDGPGDVREISGGDPDWSPDSRAVVYAETVNGALALYMVIESGATPFRNEQQQVGTGVGDYAQGPGPRWSPASSGLDSDPIAYRSRSPAGEPRVSIRRRGGADLAPLPSLTNNPSWSPSGDHLVVETGKVENDPIGLKWVPQDLAVATLNLTGTHTLKPLTRNARWPTWGK
jgi:Tol biopolymer transport system component